MSARDWLRFERRRDEDGGDDRAREGGDARLEREDDRDDDSGVVEPDDRGSGGTITPGASAAGGGDGDDREANRDDGGSDVVEPDDRGSGGTIAPGPGAAGGGEDRSDPAEKVPGTGPVPASPEASIRGREGGDVRVRSRNEARKRGSAVREGATRARPEVRTRAGTVAGLADPFAVREDRLADLPADTEAAARSDVAASTPGVDETDIAGFRRTEDDQLQAVLSEDAREAQARQEVAAGSEAVDPDDVLGFTESGDGEVRPVLNEDARREQLAAANSGIEEEDIDAVERTDEGVRAVLDEDAREERARERFEQQRQDARADRELFRAAGTEPDVPLESFASDDLEFQATGDGVEVRPTDAAVESQIRQDLSDQAGVQPSDVAVRREGDQFVGEVERPPGDDAGGPLDAGRLLNTDSPGTQLFGTEERERAIEQEAVEGSLSARTFVGGEAFGAAGRDASQALDERVPDLDQSVQAPVLLPGTNVREVEANPRVGIGTEGDRVGQQLRDLVVGTPASVGVAAGLAPKAAGDIGLRVESALGRDVDDDAQIGAGETLGATGAAGQTVVQGAQQQPVGTAVGLLGPGAASRAFRGAGAGGSATRRFLDGETRPGGRLETETPKIRERTARSDTADFRAQTQASRRARQARESGDASGGLDEFLADERGQLDLTGSSRSRGSTGESTGDVAGGRQTSPDFDPRVFERARGRGPGRSAGIEPEIGTRGPRTSETGGFRQQVQRARQVPDEDLRQATDLELSPTGRQATLSREVGAGGVFGTASAAVTGGQQQRLEEAQQPEVRIGDSALAGNVETTALSDLAVGEEIIQAQEPEVAFEGAFERTDDQLREDTLAGGAAETVTGLDSAVATGQDSRAIAGADTQQRGLLAFGQRSASAPRFIERGPGSRTRPVGRPTRTPRIPGIPSGFDAPGDGSGDRDSSFELEEDEIFSSGILTGEEAFDIFFGGGDDDSDEGIL